jgi:hypothetical protein
VRYLTGPWRLAVARVAAALEATATSATGAPTAARLAAAGGREDGGRRRRRRRRGQGGGGDGDIQNTFQPVDTLVVLKTTSHGPGRPAHAAAD